MRLTRAQRDALAVLVLSAERGSPWVRGGKRRSALSPVPHVHTSACDRLVRLGLAKVRQNPGPHFRAYTSREQFSVTDAGREALPPATETAWRDRIRATDQRRTP